MTLNELEMVAYGLHLYWLEQDDKGTEVAKRIAELWSKTMRKIQIDRSDNK